MQAGSGGSGVVGLLGLWRRAHMLACWDLGLAPRQAELEPGDFPSQGGRALGSMLVWCNGGQGLGNFECAWIVWVES